MSLFAELKRRNVFRVAIGYIAIAWLIAQVADLVLENFGASPWFMRSLLILLGVGLPIAIVSAWAFEITPEGIRRDGDGDGAVGTRKKSGRIIILALVMVASWFVFETFYLEREQVEDSTVSSAMPNYAAFDVEAGLSIAVLPFVNMSADAENEYFSDGISEELLNVLAKINSLRVASRTSTFLYKNKDIPIPQIARELTVNHVLEGSVRKAGNRVRITAQLIDARSDKHLWSETYDRELTDIFAIQDEISNSIVDALKLVLNVDEAAAVERAQHPTDSLEAYELYLQGRHKWRLRKEENIRESITLFEQAIALDPQFARAYLAMASAWAVLPEWSEIEVGEVITTVRSNAEKALELDPKLAEARTQMAEAAAYEHQWGEAINAYEKAIWSEPRNPTTYQWFAEALVSMGYLKQALAQIKLAYALDPASPVVNVSLTWIAATNYEDDLAYRHADIARGLDLEVKADESLFFALARRGEWERMHQFYDSIGPLPKAMHTCVDTVRDPALKPQLEMEVEQFIASYEGPASIVGMMWCRALGGQAEAAAQLLGEYADRDWSKTKGFWESNEGATAMRQTSAFKETLKRLGLVDFYRERGWPDVCEALGEDDFKCE